MKRNSTKLTLVAETIRHLAGRQLSRAAGGIGPPPTNTDSGQPTNITQGDPPTTITQSAPPTNTNMMISTGSNNSSGATV